MSRLGNFESMENPENKNVYKNVEKSQPSMKDTKKLEYPAASKIIPKSKEPHDMSDKVSKLSDREKIAYYRKSGLDSLADNRNAIMRSNEQKGGLNYRLTKLNSHNMDKLAQTRGIDKIGAKGVKESNAKWNPAARPTLEMATDKNREKKTVKVDEGKDPSLRNHSVLTRHVKKEGEAATVAHNKGERGLEDVSGNFVSKGSSGETSGKRQERLATPPGNRAETETKVRLNPEIKWKDKSGCEHTKTHNIVISQAGPQPEWSKKANDGIERTGGVRQLITDGGFRNKDQDNQYSRRPVEVSKNSIDKGHFKVKKS